MAPIAVTVEKYWIICDPPPIWQPENALSISLVSRGLLLELQRHDLLIQPRNQGVSQIRSLVVSKQGIREYSIHRDDIPEFPTDPAPTKFRVFKDFGQM